MPACKKCGYQNVDGAKYCVNCGAEMEATTPVTEAQPILKAKPLVIISAIIIIVVLIGALAWYVSESTRTNVAHISIQYSSGWQGAIGYGTKIESVDGYGNDEFKITWQGRGWIVISATIQKMDDSYDRLSVAILDENRRVLESGYTTSPYGVVSISWSS